MEKNLKNVEWGEFEIGNLFKIENCKCSNVSILQNGNTPYVGATNRSNGVLKFVKPIVKLITKGNCIAFICDGEGSVGYSVYKAEDFIGSTTVKVGRGKNLNKYTGYFITTIADTVRSKYSFGFKRNEIHLKKEKVLLPTTPQGEPDYTFMEEFMKEIEQWKLKKYRDYLVKRIDQVKDFRLVPSIKEKDWGEFYIGDLFKIFTGGDLIISNIKKGEIPVISHSVENNGVADWSKPIENRKIFNAKNTISLADRGNFWAFTQKTNFYIGTRVKALEAKFETNLFILNFICLSINKQAVKFSYGSNATAGTDKIKILLPTNNQGKPDYEYMENYIKKIEYDKLTKYLNLKLKD